MAQQGFNWLDCIDVFLNPRYRARCLLFQLLFGLFLIIPAAVLAVPLWLMLFMLAGYCVSAPFWIAPVFVLREIDRQQARASADRLREPHSFDP